MTEWAISLVLGHARGRIWQAGKSAAEALRAARARWMRNDTWTSTADLELELDRRGRPRHRHSRPGDGASPEPEDDRQLGMW